MEDNIGVMMQRYIDNKEDDAFDLSSEYNKYEDSYMESEFDYETSKSIVDAIKARKDSGVSKETAAREVLGKYSNRDRVKKKGESYAKKAEKELKEKLDKDTDKFNKAKKKYEDDPKDPKNQMEYGEELATQGKRAHGAEKYKKVTEKLDKRVKKGDLYISKKEEREQSKIKRGIF